MKSFGETRNIYHELLPLFEEVRKRTEQKLTRITEELGIKEPRIESRVKTIESLEQKARSKEARGHAWEDPLREASDIVGIRIDVVFLRDLEALTRRIALATDLFRAPINVDHKQESTLGADRMGYNGVHVDLTPLELPDGLPIDRANCELQVRTNAQAAWAMAAHDLIYKVPHEIPKRVQRRFNRLTALLELFDESVESARDEIMNIAEHPLATIIDALETGHMNTGNVHNDRSLTRDITEALVGDIGPDFCEDLVERIVDFQEQNRESLQKLSRSSNNPLLSQPEAALILLLLTEDRFSLAQRWQDAGFSMNFLQDAANKWGTRLPEPR